MKLVCGLLVVLCASISASQLQRPKLGTVLDSDDLMKEMAGVFKAYDVSKFNCWDIMYGRDFYVSYGDLNDDYSFLLQRPKLGTVLDSDDLMKEMAGVFKAYDVSQFNYWDIMYGRDFYVSYGDLKDADTGLSDVTYMCVAKMVAALKNLYEGNDGLHVMRPLFQQFVRDGWVKDLKSGENPQTPSCLRRDLKLPMQSFQDSEKAKTILMMKSWLGFPCSRYDPYIPFDVEAIYGILKKASTITVANPVRVFKAWGFRMPTVGQPQFMQSMVEMELGRGNGEFSAMIRLRLDGMWEATTTAAVDANLVQQGKDFYKNGIKPDPRPN